MIQTTEKRGFFQNLLSSFIAVLIGIGLFLASFVVLFISEGITNYAEVVKAALTTAPDAAGTNDGKFVAVTGTLGTTETVGDPLFLSPGAYVTLRRTMEMWAWVETSSTETRDKLGGGTETITTYDYRTEWTEDPKTSGFHDTTKSNPPMATRSESFSVVTASVGAWNFNVADAELPSGSDLALNGLPLTGNAVGAPVVEDHVYLSKNPAAPNLGDLRLSFDALRPGGTFTAFAKATGNTLTAWPVEEDDLFLRVLEGNRDEATATLKTEHTIKLWVMRLVGFLMMWIGMGMWFSPLHAVAGIIPFLKKGTTFLLNLVLFPIALVLTVTTIILSKIAHSPVTMVLIALSVAGGAWYMYKRNKERDAAGGAPAMMPPPGPVPPMPPPAE
jgi:hypothetical protein